MTLSKWFETEFPEILSQPEFVLEPAEYPIYQMWCAGEFMCEDCALCWTVIMSEDSIALPLCPLCGAPSALYIDNE